MSMRIEAPVGAVVTVASTRRSVQATGILPRNCSQFIEVEMVPAQKMPVVGNAPTFRHVQVVPLSGPSDVFMQI